jgi:hypothetical protein
MIETTKFMVEMPKKLHSLLKVYAAERCITMNIAAVGIFESSLKTGSAKVRGPLDSSTNGGRTKAGKRKSE